MRTIYIDAENKCHAANDGTMAAVETDFFDGKCDAFIEGYCYEVKENGMAIYPWQLYSRLEAAQAQHERQLLSEYEALINELYEEAV